mgnify:CR=1 FL=1
MRWASAAARTWAYVANRADWLAEPAEMAARLNDLLLPVVKGFGSERATQLLTQEYEKQGGDYKHKDQPNENQRSLKQWTDEVFGEGWAFGEGGDAWVGRQLGVAVSCGSAEANFCEGGSQKHTLATFLTPYEGLAAFARADYIGHHAFYDTYSDTVAERLPANCEAYLRFALQ